MGLYVYIIAISGKRTASHGPLFLQHLFLKRLLYSRIGPMLVRPVVGTQWCTTQIRSPVLMRLASFEPASPSPGCSWKTQPLGKLKCCERRRRGEWHFHFYFSAAAHIRCYCILVSGVYQTMIRFTT